LDASPCIPPAGASLNVHPALDSSIPVHEGKKNHPRKKKFSLGLRKKIDGRKDGFFSARK
jgi:hypothetical protein